MIYRVFYPFHMLSLWYLCQTWHDFWDHTAGNKLEINVHSKICLNEVTCMAFGFDCLSWSTLSFKYFHVHIIWHIWASQTVFHSKHLFLLKGLKLRMKSLDTFIFLSKSFYQNYWNAIFFWSLCHISSWTRVGVTSYHSLWIRATL